MKPEEITSMLENVSKKDIENLLGYLKVQEAENAALASGTTNKEIIEGYLNKLAELDPALGAVYPNNAQGKTIDDCLAYIEDLVSKQVKTRAGMQCVSAPSFQVFEWAVRYFMDETIEKFEKKVSTPTYKPAQPKKKTLKDLQKAKEDWQKENDRQVQEWEIAHNARIDKFENEHKLDLFPPENPYLKEENPFLDKTFPDQEELDKLLAEKENTTPETENVPGEDNPEDIDQETEDKDE